MSEYTVISLAKWIDNGSYKLTGDLILDGAITEEQRLALIDALEDGSYFYPARVRKALKVETEYIGRGMLTAYMRDTPDEMILDYAPGWDEVTFDLSGTGVTIDAFIAAVRKTNQAAKRKAMVNR